MQYIYVSMYPKKKTFPTFFFRSVQIYMKDPESAESKEKLNFRFSWFLFFEFLIVTSGESSIFREKKNCLAHRGVISDLRLRGSSCPPSDLKMSRYILRYATKNIPATITLVTPPPSSLVNSIIKKCTIVQSCANLVLGYAASACWILFF